MWFFVVCALIDNEYASLLFSQALFRIVSVYYASLQKFLKESDTYKQLICIIQRVHLKIRIGVFSSQYKDLRFFDIVVKNKSNVV